MTRQRTAPDYRRLPDLFTWATEQETKAIQERTAAALTPEQGKQLGIQQVAEAADRLDEDWKRRAYLAVIRCATQRAEFICDDVWLYLDPVDRPPEWPKPKALGGVVLKAARDGYIRRTDQSRISENGARHRSPVPVWESKVFGEDSAA